MNKLRNLLKDKGIIAVIEIENTDFAEPVCNALLKGGISCIDISLKTEAAEQSITIIKTKIPQMTVGAGIVIQKGQAKRVKDLKADFASAPGYSREIAIEAKHTDLPFIPGISTPSEIEAALSEGIKLLKFFPAQYLGGASFLKSIDEPYEHLHLSYIPVGGVNKDNLAAYADMPQVLAVGGTWIAPKNLIKNKRWIEITAIAKWAMEIWRTRRIIG